MSPAMKRLLPSAIIVSSLLFQTALAQTPAPAAGGAGQVQKAAPPAPVQAKPAELAKIKDQTGQIEALVRDLKAKRANPELVADVEV